MKGLIIMRCEECGTDLDCIGNNDLCKECDGQYQYCYSQCEFPCRRKEEQERYFTKWKPDWKEV
jgi:predicted amidophosphoribosyltransferase